MAMPAISSELELQIARYASGAAELKSSIGSLTSDQVRRPAAPGKWSVLEVVCHLSDFELLFAERMKRILAEDRPTLFNGDPDQFAAALAYDQRDLEEELQLIAAIRQHIVRIMRTRDTSAVEREGIHSTDGPLTLATLLKRIVGHIPHHAEIIRQKQQNL